MSERYTKLFVRTKAAREDLLRHVLAACSGKADGSTVIASECEIEVRRNEDASERGWGDDRDAFLYFPYVVEAVGDAERVGLDAYLARVGAVMEALCDQGMTITAASDWEPLLPGRGRLP